MDKKIEVLCHNDHEYIKSDGKLLTARIGIDSEEERLVSRIKDSKNHVILIMGIGTGRYLRKIEKMVDQFEHIVIYEPCAEIFNIFKNSKYHLVNEKISYINGDIEDLKTYMNLKNIYIRHISSVAYGNYVNLFNEEYLELLKVLKEQALLNLTNEITTMHFSKVFTENIMYNAVKNEYNGYVKDFKDVLGSVPALIVSAGPSLEKNYDLIKDFNGVIISGGRTLNKLYEDGHESVIFMSIDPGENAFTLVEDALDKEINYPFFTYVESNHKICNRYKGQKIIMESQNTSLNGNNVIKEEIGSVDSGASVANASVSLAEFLGCDPIVFVGQDLAFTDNKHHADGTKSSFDSEIKNSGLFEVDGYDGGVVETNNQFLTFLRWFEKRIEASDRSFINCTEGGVRIKGTEQMTFKTYLDRQSSEAYSVDDRINRHLATEPFNMINYEMQEMLDEVIKVKKIIGKSLNVSRDLKKYKNNEKKVNKALNKLDNLDDQLRDKFLSSNIVNYLVNDIMIRFRYRKVGNPENEITMNNYKFYFDLYEEIKAFEGLIGDLDDK